MIRYPCTGSGFKWTGKLTKVLVIETRQPVELFQSPSTILRSLGVGCTITQRLLMR